MYFMQYIVKAEFQSHIHPARTIFHFVKILLSTVTTKECINYTTVREKKTKHIPAITFPCKPDIFTHLLHKQVVSGYSDANLKIHA